MSTIRRMAVVSVIGATALLFASTGIARAQSNSAPVHAIVWAPFVCLNCSFPLVKSVAYNVGIPLGSGREAFVVDVGAQGFGNGSVSAFAGFRTNVPARCYVEVLAGVIYRETYALGVGGGVDIGKAGSVSFRLQAHLLGVVGGSVFRIGIGISK